MATGDPVKVVEELVSILRAVDRREKLAANERGARNVECYRVAVLRAETCVAAAITEAKLVSRRVADRRVEAGGE